MSVSKVCALVSLFGIVTVCAIAALAYQAGAAPKEVSLYSTDVIPPRSAQGLNPIMYNFSVQHTGDLMSEEVYIRLKNKPALWQHYLTAQTGQGLYSSTDFLLIVLKRGERANVTLTLTPYYKELNGTYWMTLDAYPKDEEASNASCDLAVIIPQVAGFDISVHNLPPDGVFKALPPSRITIRLAIHNTGNGVDRFLVQYESSRADAGWVLTPVGGIDEYGWTPDLQPDPGRQRPHVVDLAITVPAWERADATCQVVVGATSGFNRSKQMPPAFATVMALQYYDFQVNADDCPKRGVRPGELVEFGLRIYNRGNGPDEFAISPMWDEELVQGFFATVNPRTVVIAPDGTASVAYVVKVPQSASKGVYFFSADVSSSSKEIASITRSFEVEVVQSFRLDLAVATPAPAVVPGDAVDVEVTVRNAGNGLDSARISLVGVPNGWLHYFRPTEVMLLQDEVAVVSLRLIVPSDFDEAPIGVYSMSVVASSARSDAVASAPLNVTVRQFHHIEWVYGGEAIDDSFRLRPRRTVNPYERNTIDMPIEVRNYGNGDDEVSLRAVAGHPGVAVDITPARALLRRDESKLVKVHITVPFDLPPGIYQVTANASSQDTTARVRGIVLDFEVHNLDTRVPPIPGSLVEGGVVQVRSDIRVETGENISFELRVENTGTRPLPGVLVRACDIHEDGTGLIERTWFFNYTTPPIAVGDRYIVGKGPFSEASPMLVWHADAPGAHTLEFEAFVDFQSRRDNDLASVNVTVVDDKGVEPPPPALRYGVAVAVAASVLVAVAYVLVLRRRPQLDRDLYSSIYEGEFEEAVVIDNEELFAEGDTGMTPGQLALYGEVSGADNED